MTLEQKENFNKMRNALTRISKQYQTPMQLSKSCEDEYGIEYHEALEMSYENIQEDATLSVKGIRMIK